MAMNAFNHISLSAMAAFLLLANRAVADEGSDATASLSGQANLVEQYHPAFHARYSGANSLDPGSRGDETFALSLTAGLNLWDGATAYASPEIDQGFGLSRTVGLAGFPNGEAYRLGSSVPYFRLQRLYLQQSFGGDSLVITAGKFAVTDIFDTNSYAHDPARDFLNWAIIDSGAFDYAADAWGFTYGIAAEWTRDWWTLRTGLFDLSRFPNTTALVRGFGQYEIVSEFEARHEIAGRPGKVKLLGFVNRGRMGSYMDAIALAAATNAPPDTALVRRPAFRPGAALNIEQQVVENLGAFARLSWNDGSEEAFEFTEINRSLAAGLVLKGAGWSRADDAIGLAAVVNEISRPAREYFAAGGLGILIGDGGLRYGTENILESYYKAVVMRRVAVTFDDQFIANPAYNRGRGPVHVLSLRLHTEF
ncbi:MAG TPA: carbohydrate porin [Micropepsaceae bacterium]|nr:carbohydrate porin [Micropepsaceae bacterium]